MDSDIKKFCLECLYKLVSDYGSEIDKSKSKNNLSGLIYNLNLLDCVYKPISCKRIICNHFTVSKGWGGVQDWNGYEKNNFGSGIGYHQINCDTAWARVFVKLYQKTLASLAK